MCFTSGLSASNLLQLGCRYQTLKIMAYASTGSTLSTIRTYGVRRDGEPHLLVPIQAQFYFT